MFLDGSRVVLVNSGFGGFVIGMIHGDRAIAIRKSELVDVSSRGLRSGRCTPYAHTSVSITGSLYAAEQLGLLIIESVGQWSIYERRPHVERQSDTWASGNTLDCAWRRQRREGAIIHLLQIQKWN